MTDTKNQPSHGQAGAPGGTRSLEPGMTCEVTHLVAASDSPQALRLDAADEFPDVLATARMIGLMEVAAARLLHPLLETGEMSVGIGVDVKHLAATPLFTSVRARATYLGAEGKLHRFKVELLDDGGVAGEGLHTRAVVRAERLIDGARRRVNAAVQGA